MTTRPSAEAVKSPRDCALWAHSRGSSTGCPHTLPLTTGKQEPGEQNSTLGRRGEGPFLLWPSSGAPYCHFGILRPGEGLQEPRGSPLLSVYPADTEMWTQCGCLYNRVQTPKVAWHDVDEGIQTPRRVGTQAWVDHVGTCRSWALEDAPLQKDRVQKGSANLKSSVVVLWVRQCQMPLLTGPLISGELRGFRSDLLPRTNHSESWAEEKQ